MANPPYVILPFFFKFIYLRRVIVRDDDVNGSLYYHTTSFPTMSVRPRPFLHPVAWGIILLVGNNYPCRVVHPVLFSKYSMGVPKCPSFGLGIF
ncbi:hypothetical protein BDN72DRAFT_495703 [Pluteus cervinus]|uniref:Uncharacterized protein n=1 Tax=Pluteus cervinus TaxID=181527 RepID=A0ACD3AZZ5_9AGAR|nr:hypothetical protein BDN72DRAFT_495703 [Pluteus cervinus]